jgi:hypothetical protein
MRKISFFAGVVAVLVLVGVGTWIGVGKGTSNKRLKTASILGEQRDGADPLAHDASDRVNNGGIYGTLAYD